ncbi:MAG TPA: class F sortase [Terrabacter sp.]|nr:class F sortase [Terrabacter sp.]
MSAALVVAGLWFLLPHPEVGPAPLSATGPSWSTPASTGAGPVAATPSPRTRTSQTAQPSPRGSCRVGAPARLRIPTLGVDAPFERIGLDPKGRRDASGQLPLGTPTDRTKAGWYAAGPRPGSGTGTVLVDGHTYRDGSAIFQEDFARRIATGQLIQLRQDNGSTCSYRITRVWRTISSARAYPQLVASQHLYDFAGPERLLLATCGGSWNAAAGNYDDISVVLAVPADA